MLYPGLPYEWGEESWYRVIDMVRIFGFNTFEFWLTPSLFCREGIESKSGKSFISKMNKIIDYTRSIDMDVEMLCALATSGPNWITLCPNERQSWEEIQYLWERWTNLLPGVSIAGIFPGDPGACSRNGCSAETYIDRSIEIASLIHRKNPTIEIEFHTWGPPFFGWGIIHMSPDSHGQFIQKHQASAWSFSRERAVRSMDHLCNRLHDFPPHTSVAVNMGFNPDSRPEAESDGSHDARAWVREIAKTRRIHTWDYSLTEGQNSVIPHYRFERLFQQRKLERVSAPYSGGICYTMTPLLNQLSLYEAAQSFLNPDGQYEEIAQHFFIDLFGEDGKNIPQFMQYFEVVRDWGSYAAVSIDKKTYHRQMVEMVDVLHSLQPHQDLTFSPDPAVYQKDLIFFAELLRDLSGETPDFSELKNRYWQKVYGIYDHLPEHVDPRPRQATEALINNSHFG